MEQIRIVKEMRERDRTENGRTGFLIRPRYMLWENVRGALSSNGGKDFQAVLTEVVRIADPSAPDVPLFGIGGGGKRWTKSGCLYDEMGRWSVAWRIHDAQFWGVPQRRERISLIADFGGLSAPEILFERKSMSWNPEPIEQEGKETTGETGSSVTEPSSFTLKIRGGSELDRYGKRAGKGALIQTELSGTLGVSQDQTLLTIGHDERSSAFTDDEITDPLTASDYKDPIKVAYKCV
jgi:DNA (cytosine-5)-methyltransferase 1